MILDAQLLFSDAQALTATAVSTNVVDFSADRDPGVGEEMAVVIQLDVAADAGNSDETYVAAIQTDDNESFSSAATVASITITRGDAAGTRYVSLLPKSTLVERYIRISYTLGGTTPTATVTAFLVPAKFVDAYRAYADGYTIS